MSHPPSSPRSQLNARPDRAALLLEAVRQRDGLATAHLVRQWVHRCGPVSLDQFLHHSIAPQAGQDAAAWLEVQINLPLYPSPDRQPLITTAEVVGPVQMDPIGATVPDQEGAPAPIADQHPSSGGSEALQEETPVGPGLAVRAPESVFDFDPWTTFPDPTLLSTPAEPHTDAAAASALGQALGIEPAKRQSWDFGSARIEAEPGDPTDFGLTDLAQADPGSPTSSPAALEPLVREPLERQQDEGAGFVSAPLRRWTVLRSSLPIAKGLRAFSRVKELMQDCLDEAIVGLQPPWQSHDERADLNEPPAGQSAPIGTRVESTRAESPRAGFASRPRANPMRTSAGTLPTTAALPAPTPEALADLRAWLPESQDKGNLPKAS